MKKLYGFAIVLILCVSFTMKSQNCNASYTYSQNGNVVTLSNTSTFPASLSPVFIWELGPGNSFTTTSVAQTYSFTANSNGKYAPLLHLTVPSNTCSGSYLDSIPVLLPGCSLWIQKASTSSGGINTAIVNFSCNALNTTSNTTYSWDFGDGTTSNLAAPTHTYSGLGTYIYSVVAINNATCSAFYIPSFYSEILGGPTQILGPYIPSITYTPTSNGNVNFTVHGFNNHHEILWFFGDNSTGISTSSTDMLASHTFFNGTYTVVANVNIGTPLALGFYPTVVVTVTNGVPCIVNSNISHTAGLNGAYQFSPSAAPSGSNIGYRWEFGDGTISFVTSPSHTYTNAGTHSVSLLSYNTTNTLTCHQYSLSYINVTSVPCVANSGFTIIPYIGMPHYYNIQPLYPYNVTHCYWDWGDNSSDTAFYTSHTYSASGTYSICLTVTTSCGSISTSCLNQFLLKQIASNEMINVFVTPPPQTVGMFESVNELISFSVFPNPNEGVFYVNLNQKINLINMEVFDLMGRIIRPKGIDIIDGNYKLDLGDIPNGVYLFQINNSQATLRSRLVISK